MLVDATACGQADSSLSSSRSWPSASPDPEGSTVATAREPPGACGTRPGPPQACTARAATEAAARSPSNPGPDDRRSRGRPARTCRCSRPRYGRPRRGPAGSAGPPRCRDRADRGRGCHDLLSRDAQPPVTAIAGMRCGDSARTDSRPATRRRVRGTRTAQLTHHHEVGPATTESGAATLLSLDDNMQAAQKARPADSGGRVMPGHVEVQVPSPTRVGLSAPPGTRQVRLWPQGNRLGQVGDLAVPPRSGTAQADHTMHALFSHHAPSSASGSWNSGRR